MKCMLDLFVLKYRYESDTHENPQNSSWLSQKEIRAANWKLPSKTFLSF